MHPEATFFINSSQGEGWLGALTPLALRPRDGLGHPQNTHENKRFGLCPLPASFVVTVFLPALPRSLCVGEPLILFQEEIKVIIVSLFSLSKGSAVLLHPGKENLASLWLCLHLGLIFFFRLYLFTFKEGEGKKKERERLTNVREKHRLLSSALRPGTKPATQVPRLLLPDDAQPTKPHRHNGQG